MKNQLFYGDNLEVLRKYIKDETVDLCYIDPPFNSKRNYNQIYNNIGSEDRAQAQAFVDTWTWDSEADSGFEEICGNDNGRFNPKTVDLITGLQKVLGKGSLLAYLVSMTLRVVEIHRSLRTTGSLYLHCDPTASHYLKVMLDGIFLPQKGEFQNEIVWHYSGWNKRLKDHFEKRSDTLLFYSKSQRPTFNSYCIPWANPDEYVKTRKQKVHYDDEGHAYVLSDAGKGKRIQRYLDQAMEYGSPVDNVWGIDKLNNSSKERLGYPTQKPEALLERIISASTNEGDTVLDAYCGCGTTIAVAQRLGRKWIGIDITYQSISLILRRLEGQHKDVWPSIEANITLNGIPQDMDAARALANKKDDRVRKEFEKWAVLTYTRNRAVINEKKGADGGIDGTAYFVSGKSADYQHEKGAIEAGKIVFQVKSGNVNRGDVAKLNSDRQREGAELAVLITLESPSQPMIREAKGFGQYNHEMMGRCYDVVQIVTVDDIINKDARLDIPTNLEVLKKAQQRAKGDQLDLLEA